MPVYQYECKKCGERFEAMHGIFEGDDKVACPKCGEKKLRRVVSRFFNRSQTEYRGNLRFPT